MTRTSIEWATDSWNPIAAYDRETGKRGWFCTKVSPGCTNCYAEVINRRLGNGHLYRIGNLDKVRFELAPTLTDPLHWRKPRRVFVNSMTDLFLEAHTDEMIDEVFSVMGAAPDHDFLVLTKRAERQRDYMKARAYRAWNSRRIEAESFPPRNVWLGVSAENQVEADRRIPLLLDTPAVIRFLSCEPLLGPIAFPLPCVGSRFWTDLHWVIVGGESGADARPCDADWIRKIVKQCHSASVACFAKQLGARAYDSAFAWECVAREYQPGPDQSRRLASFAFDDPKGGDPKEWPTELRVRQYPKQAVLV